MADTDARDRIEGELREMQRVALAALYAAEIADDSLQAWRADQVGATDATLTQLSVLGMVIGYTIPGTETRVYNTTKLGEFVAASLDAAYEMGRDARDAELDSFDVLCDFARKLLDRHYPEATRLVCDRHSDDPGPRLIAALRDCLAATKEATNEPA